MNKTLIKSLNDYFSRGVNTGAMAMSLAMVISLENVMPEYITDEDTLGEIYRAMEKDLAEVWDEAVTEAGKGNGKDVAEILIGHAEAIRKKRGMEELE